jgi:hypothetical protein
MLQGITVDLGTGRENESSLLIPGYFQRIDRLDAPGFKGLNREAQIVGRRRRGCKVKYVFTSPSIPKNPVISQLISVKDGLAVRCERLAADPVMRLSRQTTCKPRARRRSQRCEPRKPAPPR